MFTLLLAVSIHFNYALSKNVPNIMEYKKISSTGISFKKLYKVKEKFKEITFTGYSEIPCDIKNSYEVLPGKDIKTKAVLTDENFCSLYSYKLVEGNKIDYHSVQNGAKIAVISDILANDLYKSTKVIGNVININEENYKIVGVYKTNNSFTYNISNDGYERIIIPYSAYISPNKKENILIDVFTTMETDENSSRKINNELMEILGPNLSLYNMENYTLWKKIIFQYTKILCFLIGSYGIVVLIKLLVKYFKNFITLFKESLKNNYFCEVIKENKKEILTIWTKVVPCLVGIISIFSLIKFNVVINDKYLPWDNIFDLDFYRETIVRNMQLINANENGFSNIYNRYLTNISRIGKIALIGEVVAFIFIVINGRALMKSKCRQTTKANRY